MKKNTSKKTSTCCCLGALLFVVIGAPSPVRAADTEPALLSLSVTTVAPTCTLSRDDGNGSPLSLAQVRHSDFASSASPAKASGKLIRLKLTDCAGLGGSLAPTITVWGDRVDTGGSDSLYRGAASQATGVGFALTANDTGDGPFLPAGTQGAPTAVPVPGANGQTLPNNKTVDFFVQVSRDSNAYAQVGSGALTAALHFDFVYQ